MMIIIIQQEARGSLYLQMLLDLKLQSSQGIKERINHLDISYVSTVVMCICLMKMLFLLKGQG